MFDFRTVPVDQAVQAVRCWAEMDWPVTREQALAMVDRLGWTRSEDDRGFTTDFGLDQDDGSLSAVEGTLDYLTFRLATVAPKGTDADVMERSWAAFAEYRQAFVALWGEPFRRGTHRQITGDDWMLPNGVALTLFGADRTIVVQVTDSTFHEALEASHD